MNVFAGQVAALAGLDAGSAVAGAAAAALLILAAGTVRGRRRQARELAERRRADAEAGIAERLEGLGVPERSPDLADIPIVDSATDEIPEGLVLLPAPPPVPRWRGFALALASGGFTAAALIMLAGSGTLTRDGREPTKLAGALDQSTVAFEEAAARPEASPEPGAAAPEHGERDGAAVPPAAGENRRREPSDEGAGAPEEPSVAPAAIDAPAEPSSPDEETAAPAEPEEPGPATPDAGGGSDSALPDLSGPIEQVGSLIDEVIGGTEALPLPSLPPP